jgi:putative tryptophan/tyrosine transport system substrate-binding protein
VKRRQFITLLGGVAAMRPLAARAQEPAPGRWRIGILGQKRRQDLLREGLRELKYVEGENLTIDARSNEQADRLPALAAELVRLKPNAIFTAGTQATQAVQQATSSIPIVMFASDPVGNRLVASLAHPGGNTTGVSALSSELSGKRIELLRTVVGELPSLAILWNPDDPPAAIALQEAQKAAATMGLPILTVEARAPKDFAPAFQMIANAQPKGLLTLNAPLMSIHAAPIADLALGLKLPASYTDRAFPDAGGLMSYGPNFDAMVKRAATYFDKIFKGEKPADLPVEQPTKFELVINLKTAKSIGVTVPDRLLAIADEVIE